MDGAAAEKTKDKETELDTELDFDVVEEGSAEAKALAEAAKGQNEEEDGDEGDERLSRHAGDANASEGDAEEVEQRRSKSKSQRRRLKEKLDQKDSIIVGLRQQLQNQNDRLSTIERRTGTNELAMLDKSIGDTRLLVDQMANAHTQSLTQNDPALVTQSMNNLFEARKQLEGLESLKQQVVTHSQRPAPTNVNVTRNVNAFMARNPWYKPNTDDEDSQIVQILDNKIAAEGYDASTPEYWNELSRRIKKRLPHRSKGVRREEPDDDEDDMDDNASDRRAQTREDDRAAPKSNVSGSGSSGRASGGKKKVMVSRERVQALKDAGIWDDPVRRNKMIKQYQDYDRQNSGGR